jgi:hypothetical membrane protein
MRSSQYIRLTFALGLSAPMYFFMVLQILGMMWPGYNFISRFMSEVGGVESPNMVIMNVFGFMALGLMIMVFGSGFWLYFKKNIWLKVSSFLLVFGGLFMFLVGFFPCDPGCVEVTLTGRLHTLTSFFPALAWPAAAILAAVGFYKEKGWGVRWFVISLLLGGASFMFGSLMSLPQVFPVIGLAQRAAAGMSLLWIAVVAGRLLFMQKTR